MYIEYVVVTNLLDEFGFVLDSCEEGSFDFLEDAMAFAESLLPSYYDEEIVIYEYIYGRCTDKWVVQ